MFRDSETAAKKIRPSKKAKYPKIGRKKRTRKNSARKTPMPVGQRRITRPFTATKITSKPMSGAN